MAIEKEILVYQSIPFKKYRWIGYLAIAQVGFLVANLFALPTSKAVRGRQELIEARIKKKEERDLETIKANSSPLPVDNPSNTLEELTTIKKNAITQSKPMMDIFSINNLSDNINSRPYTAAALGGASLLVLAAAFSYSRRMIHMITLLPNKQVRISVFSPLPLTKPPTIELPLVDVSCRMPRSSQTNYAILKLRNYTGYHLVHKLEGEFVEPELYDQYLGYERSWAKK